MRLFVGLPLPEDVRERLAGLCAGVPGARWVQPDMFHLTLRFIGEVDGGWFDDIDAALRTVAPPAFELNLLGVGHWERKGKATTLWAGVEKNAALVRLRDKVESALVRLGLEPEGRKYAPHVTLARLYDATPGRVVHFLADHGLFRTRPLPVESFALFSSFLSHGGAIYTPEAEYPLVLPHAA
ncbi:MAG: RNA 2',3'-cyclic phosphodiesterase [Proteobacteria bacterium]|nr:RNA 2',3'-cyclic phosphodiesterase [Pseudomonadota bacterium]